MSDHDFLEMEPRPALEYWRNADTPKERERLHHLYLVKRKVNLSDMALREDAGQVSAAPQVEPRPTDLVPSGFIVLWLGIAVSIGAFIFMDPSVEVPGAYGAVDRVANFDLMERRALVIGFGNAIAVVGAVFTAAGYVIRSLAGLGKLSNP